RGFRVQRQSVILTAVVDVPSERGCWSGRGGVNVACRASRAVRFRIQLTTATLLVSQVAMSSSCIRPPQAARPALALRVRWPLGPADPWKAIWSWLDERPSVVPAQG